MKQRNKEVNPILIYPYVFVSLFLLLLAAAAPALAQKNVSAKPRTIVTTDGESDDKSSFTRFLLYTTDFDIAGLIYTNSKWHLKGNGTRWMHNYIDEYAKVYDNLRVHHPDYPDPNHLKSQLYVGQLEQVGRAAVGEGNDTPGSDRIVEVLLDSDPRPVWLQAWSGLNNICQAFYRIKTSHPEQLPKVNQKARVYAIAEQDDLREWLQTEMPDVMYLLNGSQFWRVIAYAPDRKNPLQDHEVYSEGWVSQHIKSTGPLGATYTRRVQEEGDSPAFFHLIQTGLRSTGHPSWGGWGGRFSHQGPGISGWTPKTTATTPSPYGGSSYPFRRILLPG